MAKFVCGIHNGGGCKFVPGSSDFDNSQLRRDLTGANLEGANLTNVSW